MISVIIPVYNAEKTIENSLASIKNQTWKGVFEILIVNDGSTDESQKIIQNYHHRNPDQNIILINQENGGVSKARNTALKLAKGEFIALLDADDEWLTKKTERQMGFFDQKKIEIDFLATKRVHQDLKFPYQISRDDLVKITFRKLMFRNEAQPSTVIFKKIVLENTGVFDDTQRYSEDLNYWLKISEHNEMYLLNEELVFAGSGKRSFGVSGLSANLNAMEKGFQKNLTEMYDLRRINLVEYCIYFIFYRLKFVIRIGRNQILKYLGR